VVARRGKAEAISEDHKPELEREKRRILKAGSIITEEGRVDDGLNLTRAIGDLRYKRDRKRKAQDHAVTAHPDTFRVPLSPDLDFVVLACDGVWELKD